MGITYTDENMTKSADLCIKSLLANGVAETYRCMPQRVEEEFKFFNKDIFQDGARGAGCYWLFKPYIIYQFILGLKDNDTLIYSDAGVEWIDNAKNIIEVMDQDIFLFTSGHLEHEYNKMDVIKYILPEVVNSLNGLPVLTDTFLSKQQVHASVIFIRVSEWSRRFIKEWLCLCQIPAMIDDSPSILPNHPSFKDHRHDQSILSLLAIRENLTLHYWPDALWFSTQRFRWPDDKYPLLFNHHRRRNDQF